MLTLSLENICLNQQAQDKQAAIKKIAAALQAEGFIQAKYVEGMLQREQVNSTYLGNGIAIPHGTTDTRDQVIQTGVSVHHFPEGVDWGDGNIVYLAIGIAAKSGEHLMILKQLTKVLSVDGAEELIKNAKDSSTIMNLINGDTQLEIEFDASLILEDFPVQSMVQLNAVAAGTLKNKDLLNQQGIATSLEQAATYLGNGYWLNCVAKGALRSGICVIKVQEQFQHHNKPVNGLIMISAANACYLPALKFLGQQVYQDQLAAVAKLSKVELITSLTENKLAGANPAQSDGNVAIFQIVNPHGLHARPGALLVAEAKKFKSNITVVNVDSEAPAVNAKSLMKVMTLGVKYQSKLQFTAEGEDAQEALKAIGEAIAAGLGEL
ncbi:MULTISPECIES: fused PTS fructose transporter subunit IIA/HPr protein [unclassified Agarivorans]|uniref:fused PTS fructose transporter subunit IIA/HPr protein n=1 Tax=unclassified Agarivorans TaxID=2636026 RepID=UPI003D7F11B5